MEGTLQAAKNSVDRYDDVDKEQCLRMTKMLVSVPAGQLIDMIAQRGEACKYTWSALDRVDCYAGAIDTVDLLIKFWNLEKPIGLSEARNWIDALKVAFVRVNSSVACGGTDAEGD